MSSSVNVDFIHRFETIMLASDVIGVEDVLSCGHVTLIKAIPWTWKLIQWINTNKSYGQQNLELACKVEHIVRYWSRYSTWEAAKKVLVGKWDHCSNCGWPGHHAPNCPN